MSTALTGPNTGPQAADPGPPVPGHPDRPVGLRGHPVPRPARRRPRRLGRLAGLDATSSWPGSGTSLSCLGVTVGYHRYFTHGSFKAKPWLRTALAVAGSFAVQGEIIQWVADHRRHHAFSDLEGDPHSPWRFGESVRGLTRGLFHAHIGWLFDRELSNRERFAPDLLADPATRRVDRLFPPLVAISMAGPAAMGGLLTGSWQGALTAFFWGGLVRVALLHHVTWAINSVCHVYGERPFAMRRGTGPRTSGRWRCCRSGRAGTTCTTPSRPARGTGCCAVSSTRRRG